MARLTLERLSITILLVLVGVSLPQAEQPQKPDQVVALVNGKPITLSEVDGRAGARLSRLSSQIYELRQVFLNELIGEMLLEEEATTQGVSLEDYKEQLLKSAEVTDAEVDEIIRQMYPPEASGNDVLRERVRLQVEDNRKRDLLKSKREELRKSAQIEVLLTRPVVPPVHVGTGHRRPLGNPDGSITVVEFADFQCDHCRAAAPVVKQVLTTHGHQVRYFYRHFPLPHHRYAYLAAQAAECADEQREFWDYHDALFENASELSLARLIELAKTLNLDVQTFERCLMTERFRSVVEEDIREGREAGVSATPTFFVNGKRFSGVPTLEQMQRIIEQEATGSASRSSHGRESKQ